MLDAADQKVIDDIAEYGWHCVHVPEDDVGPGFSFSVGFWETIAAPEAVVFGLGRELMHHMLWESFRQLQAGKTFQDGERWSSLIEGFDCVSRPVHSSQLADYLGIAIWYRRYRTNLEDLAAFQLFWPGRAQGLYPWETGCDESVRAYQPSLYLPQGQRTA